MKAILAMLILSTASPALYAQDHSLYSGQQAREIKALSEEQIKQYIAGAGMGYAKAAVSALARDQAEERD